MLHPYSHKNDLSTAWKILIIDDDEEDFLITKNMLKEAKGRKFDVHWAATYQAGRDKLASDDYNAVLVDYDLGAHSGIELIREVNARGFISPLILFTGRGNYEVDVEAMEAGATFYLTKDEVNPLLLERAIRSAVELKQREYALRLSEERFYKAFNANPNPQVLSRQEDGRIEFINDGFEQLFGYRRDEVVGKTSQELNILVFPAQRQEAVQRLRENHSLRDFEVSIRVRSGEIRHACLATEVVMINSESLFLTVIQDITERKRAEEAILQDRAKLEADLVKAKRPGAQEHHPMPEAPEMEQVRSATTPQARTEEALKQSIEREKARAAELETLMDTVPAMIWISRDPQCLEMTGNRYGYEFLEMWQGANISKTASEEDLKHQPYRNFKDGREIPTEELPMQIAASTGKPTMNFDFDLVFNDGTVRTVLGNVTPLFGEDNQPRGAVAAFMDITDRRKVEEQLQHYAQELERSNQALQEFAFIASHDLQEPLRKILMFGNSLQRHLNDNADKIVLDYLARMQNAAQRMQAMINGLLELSRVKTHAQEFTSVDLNRLVAEVVLDLEAQIRAVGGRVEIENLPTIAADELQMQLLFQNLIGNAIKFHQPDTPPVVRVSGRIHQAAKTPMVEIQVEDNGIGFEQKYASRIFQPFQRLHSRNEYEGTGLGLAICQKIIERHQGAIKVHSSPGQGSIFTFSIPLISKGIA